MSHECWKGNWTLSLSLSASGGELSKDNRRISNGTIFDSITISEPTILVNKFRESLLNLFIVNAICSLASSSVCSRSSGGGFIWKCDCVAFITFNIRIELNRHQLPHRRLIWKVVCSFGPSFIRPLGRYRAATRRGQYPTKQLTLSQPPSPPQAAARSLTSSLWIVECRGADIVAICPSILERIMVWRGWGSRSWSTELEKNRQRRFDYIIQRPRGDIDSATGWNEEIERLGIRNHCQELHYR